MQAVSSLTSDADAAALDAPRSNDGHHPGRAAAARLRPPVDRPLPPRGCGTLSSTRAGASTFRIIIVDRRMSRRPGPARYVLVVLAAAARDSASIASSDLAVSLPRRRRLRPRSSGCESPAGCRRLRSVLCIPRGRASLFAVVVIVDFWRNACVVPSISRDAPRIIPSPRLRPRYLRLYLVALLAAGRAYRPWAPDFGCRARRRRASG